DDAFSLVAADETGRLVASIDSLIAREGSVAPLGGAQIAHRDSLFVIDWVETSAPTQVSVDGLVLLGGGTDSSSSSLARALDGIGDSTTTYADLQALSDALSSGAPTPRYVLYDCDTAGEIEGLSGEGFVAV